MLLSHQPEPQSGNTPNAICWLDKDLRFVLVSRTAESLWGLRLDEIQGMSMLDILDETSVAATSKSLQKIRQTGDVGLIENTIKLRDGRTRTFLWKASWSSDLRGYFCLAQDISDCKTARLLEENFLAMVSHDIRAPLTSLLVGIEFLLAGKRGTIPPTVQKELQRITVGAKKLKELSDELIDLGKLEAGKEDLNWKTMHAFNICALAKEARAADAQSKRISLRGPAKDVLVFGDEMRLVQAMSNLLSYSLNVAAAGSVITLNVQRKQTSVEFSVTAHGASAITVEDPFKMSRMFDGASIISGRAAGLPLAMVKAIVEAHRGDVGVRNSENEGMTLWFRIPCSAPQEEEQEWLYVRICRPLLRLHEYSNVALLKQNLLEIVCAELQSTLRSILASLFLVRKGAVAPINTDVQEEIEIAHRNVQRLIAFVNDFIDFQKLSSGRQALQMEPHLLSDIINEAIAAVAPLANDRDVNLHMQPTDATILCDGPKVVQLLINLLTNAIKFTPPGGDVEISCFTKDNRLILSVSDFGPGISPEHKDLIFDAFEQGPGKSNKEGTGLGLAICKLMAEAHGWAIAAANREECPYFEDQTEPADKTARSGAVFSVSIPM